MFIAELLKVLFVLNLVSFTKILSGTNFCKKLSKTILTSWDLKKMHVYNGHCGLHNTNVDRFNWGQTYVGACP